MNDFDSIEKDDKRAQKIKCEELMFEQPGPGEFRTKTQEAKDAMKKLAPSKPQTQAEAAKEVQLLKARPDMVCRCAEAWKRDADVGAVYDDKYKYMYCRALYDKPCCDKVKPLHNQQVLDLVSDIQSKHKFIADDKFYKVPPVDAFVDKEKDGKIIIPKGSALHMVMIQACRNWATAWLAGNSVTAAYQLLALPTMNPEGENNSYLLIQVDMDSPHWNSDQTVNDESLHSTKLQFQTASQVQEFIDQCKKRDNKRANKVIASAMLKPSAKGEQKKGIRQIIFEYYTAAAAEMYAVVKERKKTEFVYVFTSKVHETMFTLPYMVQARVEKAMLSNRDLRNQAYKKKKKAQRKVAKEQEVREEAKAQRMAEEKKECESCWDVSDHLINYIDGVKMCPSCFESLGYVLTLDENQKPALNQASMDRMALIQQKRRENREQQLMEEEVIDTIIE